MTLSARNRINGEATSVEMGVVNAEVTVEVVPGLEITAMITKQSSQAWGLEVGQEARVLIKASNVMVGTDS